MQITVFSFLMSAIWSSVIILLIHLCRKKQFFLNGFGLMTVILFYVFSIGRMLFAIEFPFTQEVSVPKLYNRFFNVIREDHFLLGENVFSLADAFLILWCAVSTALLLVFGVQCVSAKKSFRAYRMNPDARLQAVLADVQNMYRRKLRIRILECPDISIPMGVGILNKCILIPKAEYSDKALRDIILHEYMHFRNKDLLILHLTELFTRVFWWNPFMYLLKADIRQVLEIKCDLSVISDMPQTQRADYLRTLYACLEQSKKLKSAAARPVSTQLFYESSPKEDMLERIALIARPIQKNYIRFQIISIVCFALLLLISYSFILQPKYLPPPEEIYEIGTQTSGTLSGYILEKKDGTHIFVDNSGFEFELSPESFEVFSEMYEIRKE